MRRSSHWSMRRDRSPADRFFSLAPARRRRSSSGRRRWLPPAAFVGACRGALFLGKRILVCQAAFRRAAGADSINRHRRIDLARPCVYSPGQVVDVLVTLALQEHGDLGTTRAKVTDTNHRALRIDAGEARRYLPHRQRRGTRDRADLLLPWLAHVEQQWRRAFLVV